MKFEQLAETDTYKQFWAAMTATENMEFWVLKTQIYIEYRLKHLLAFRLGIAEAEEEIFIKQFETIQYRHLSLLALAGTNSDRLLSYLEKLNNVRREVAHRF